MNVIETKRWCENCPLRLYNTKGYSLSGTGTPYHKLLIIVPNVDYIAYKNKDMSFSSQVDIIKEVFSSTGVLEPTIYIVPLIRCNENISCNVNEDVINRCLNYTNRDITVYGFTRILVLGNAVKRLLQCNIKDNIDTYFDFKHFIVEVNYAPLVKYTDKDLYDIFKRKLITWYNESINNVYTNKKIIRTYD